VDLGYGSAFLNKVELLFCFAVIGFLFVVNWCERRGNISVFLGQLKPAFRWGVYFLLTMGILFTANFSTKADFIYFQF
jgi:hypothetical protein